MVPSLPVPTDNLWKFSALFGLALIVSSITGITYVHQSTNELIYASVVDRARLEMLQQADPVARSKIAVIDKKLEIAASDKPVLSFALTALLSAGLVISGWGFYNWWRYQPIQDRLLELQIAKAEREERKALEDALRQQEPPT